MFTKPNGIVYKKPEILAQSKAYGVECRPNNKPSGSPCNPPMPGSNIPRP